MLTVATLIWGTVLIAQRVGANSVGPFTFNAVRFLIVALTLLPFILLTDYHMNKFQSNKDKPKAGANLLIKGGLLCGCIIFVTATLGQIGIAYTSIGKAAFITALYIIIIPVLGLFRGRHINPQIWGCIFLATFGMYLLCINGQFTLGFGDTLFMLCAFSTAIHILVIAFYSNRVDCVKLSFLQFFVCGVLSLIAAFVFERPELKEIAHASAPILYTGILSCGIAYTLQTMGQKHVSPVTASLILSLESVFSVLSGWIILGETLSLKEIWGCTLMFIAVLTSQAPVLGNQKLGNQKNETIE